MHQSFESLFCPRESLQLIQWFWLKFVISQHHLVSLMAKVALTILIRRSYIMAKSVTKAHFVAVQQIVLLARRWQ